MKSPIRNVLVCVLALLAACSAPFLRAALPEGKSPLTYLVLISSPAEEVQAGVLVRSIRAFGGEFRSAPVVLVVADPSLGLSLANQVDARFVLKMNEQLRSFPFSEKVYACAQVEEMMAGRTRWLLWLNPDALLIAPPQEIVADANAWAALRPVHVRNVGDLADGPVSEFWRRIYETAGLDAQKAWTVSSFIDQQTLRGYFNSGCMAFDPERKLLRHWADAYERLLLNPANRELYRSKPEYSIYCHQAVLSAVVMARADRDKIHVPPPAYGYPVSQQGRSDFTTKIASAADLVVLLCQDYRFLKGLTMPEPYRSWLAANLPEGQAET